MHLETIIQIATLLSVVIGIGGLCIGVWIYRRQVNTEVFLEYTRRYEEIMTIFPQGARAARLALKNEPPPPSEELSLAVLRYLNLCSEEFYLHRRGYLSRDVWNIWEGELHRTLASPLLLREWRVLRAEFECYPDFLHYVNNLQGTDGARSV